MNRTICKMILAGLVVAGVGRSVSVDDSAHAAARLGGDPALIARAISGITTRVLSLRPVVMTERPVAVT